MRHPDAAITTAGAALEPRGLWLDELAEPLPSPGWDPAHEADRRLTQVSWTFLTPSPVVEGRAYDMAKQS